MSTMSVSEALKDFRKRSPGANDQLEKFIGAPHNTVRLWGYGREPGAGNMIRLQVFLSELGYKLDAPFTSQPVLQYLAKLIAFGVLSDEDAHALVFSNNERLNRLWAALRGNRTPTSILQGRMTLGELTAAYGDELTSQQAKMLPASALFSTPEARPRAGPRQRSTPRLGSGKRSEESQGAQTSEAASSPLIVMTCGALMNCLPYLKALDIQNNPEVGTQVRNLMGSDNFHDVLDMLKALSSREANKFFSPSSR